MNIAFGLLALLVLVGAAWVVSLRNLFRAALSLGLVLLGVAGIFLLLEAEFLAFVQILVYVGAILVLIVFAIMLTARLQGAPSVPASRQRIPAAIAAGALFLILGLSTQALLWPAQPAEEAIQAAALGGRLVTTLVLPFEVVSLIFVAALVGAIAIAAKSPQPPEPAAGRHSASAS